MSVDCSFVVPFRQRRALAADLQALRRDCARMRDLGCDVIVVDGSPPRDFALHATVLRGVCRHVPVDPRWRFLNGKVNGVLTGVALARHEAIILADDDVSYSPLDVHRMCHLLRDHDLVVPQNYFRPLPLWARVESARMLLNRAFRAAGDPPGTHGVRRSTFLALGPYDGDVLFENEAMRLHFVAGGARVRHARDFFIARRPPRFAKWREQRLRQAYEDIDRLPKTCFFVGWAPLVAALFLIGPPSAALAVLAAIAVGTMQLAASGRDRAAARVIPAGTAGWAPVWLLERTVSVYRALWARVRHGGCTYGDVRIPRGLPST